MLSTPEYVLEALKHLGKEEDIARKYYPSSEHPVIQIIQKNIIIDNAEVISNADSGI